MLNQTKTIYYENELTDEFSTAEITPRKIDGSFSYNSEKPARRIGHFFWYKLLARPLAKLFLKLKFHHRIVNGEVLTRHLEEKRQAGEKAGYFLYGNHTNALADALIPSMVSLLTAGTDAYVIVHPNNVSMPVLGRITPCLGALPLPDDAEAARNFLEAVEQQIQKGNSVTIYPEAHIWPYCTGIRNFPDSSFRYPLQQKAPVFCFTNTYHRSKNGRGIDIITYVDGPFYGDDSLAGKARRKNLRDRVYETMVERSKENTLTLVRYLPKEQTAEKNKNDQSTIFRK